MIRRTAQPVLLTLAGCCSWMLSGVASPFGWQNRYDDARLAQCCAIGLMMVLALLQPGPIVRTLRRWPSKVRLGLSISLILGMVSASRSNFPAYASIEVALIVALLIAGISTRWICAEAEEKTIRLALLIAAAGPLMLGMHFATDYLTAVITDDARGLDSSWNAFVYPRYFAKAATWALPLLWLAPYLTTKPYQALRATSAIASVVIWSQLFGSGGRGALLGMAISAAVAALFFGRPGRCYALLQTASAAGGILLWSYFVWAYDVPAPTRILNDGLSGRSGLYQAALDDIASAPLLGIGPMHYAEYGRHPLRSVAGVHDFPLQFAAEWGLPAALMLIAVLFRFYKLLFDSTHLQCVTEYANTRTKIQIAIFCALTAALVHGLVANVFNDPISQTLAVLTVGVFPLSSTSSPADLHPRPSMRAKVVLCCLVLLTGGTLLLAVIKGSRCVGHPGAVEYFQSADQTIYPRFWSQGIIPLEQTCRARSTGG